MEEYINEKISILRDFNILKYNSHKQEDAIRKILGNCKSEIQIDQKLHDILCGNETLKDLIKREELN